MRFLFYLVVKPRFESRFIESPSHSILETKGQKMGLNFCFSPLEMAFSGVSASYSDADLQRLAEKAKEGNVRAEDVLLRWALKRINEILRAKIRGNDDARDEIRRTCCFEFWKGIKHGKYDEQRATVGAYLWGILNVLVKAYFKDQKTRTSRIISLDAMEPEKIPKIDEAGWQRIGGIVKEIDLEQDEQQKRLRDCIERLPETQRMVVISTYFENESHAVAGMRLGKQAQQVYDLKRLAKARLKKCLEKYFRA